MTKDTEYEQSIKKVPFDGTDKKWRDWEGIALAYADARGFRRFLMHQVDTCTEEDTWLDSTSAEKKKKYRLNAEAYAFLMQSCGGPSRSYVENAKTKAKPNGDAHMAWTQLVECYKSSDIASNYAAIEQKFLECKISDFKDSNPELWVQDLDYWNRRLGDINEGYARDSLQMKAHIMANLPRDYEAVKVKYGSCLSQVNAGDFLKDIIDFWKRQRSKASKREVAMNVNKKKGKKKDDKKEKPAEEKKEIVANTNDKDKNPNLNRDGKPKKIVD
jgi:hypothetical protein